MSRLIFQPNETILFVGDSITDCGRRGAHAPYGNGYVRIIFDWLEAGYADHNLKIINRGIAGDTSRNLVTRWDKDVAREKPDWLIIKIGINDVWRFLDKHHTEAVSVGEFEQNYRTMLNWLRPRPAGPNQRKTGLILVEPFLIEPDSNDIFRKMVERYQEVVQELAAEYETRLVCLQGLFDQAMDARPPKYWAEDRVHPTHIGHTLIAREILNVCGYGL